MKNMKKLIALVAVFAMMLSMASVAFAAVVINPATETFAINVDSKDVTVGSTDEFTIRVGFEMSSPTYVSISTVTVYMHFDTSVITFQSWDPSPDMNPAKLLRGSTAPTDGSQGALRFGYTTSSYADALKAGISYYDIHFKLADGVAAGASTALTLTPDSTVNVFSNTNFPNNGWISRTAFPNYVHAGTVNVKDIPKAGVTGGGHDSNFDPANPRANYHTKWGKITNKELLGGNTYGVVAYAGEGDFDATTAGAELYKAEGNLEDGTFAVRLLGDLVPEVLRFRTYIFDGTNYTYGDITAN